MKKNAVANFYCMPIVRLLTLAILTWLPFQPLDLLFFFIFIFNIPHFFISMVRKSRSSPILKNVYWFNEFFIFGIGIFIAMFSVEWLYYLAFIRFMLHFFEDEFFNLGFHNFELSVLLTGLFLSAESLVLPLWSRGLLSVIGVVYFIYKTPRRSWVEVLNFYPFLLVMFFVPSILKMNFNSSHWGYGVGILHTLMWMTWDGFDKDYSFSRMIKSQSFVITVIFALSVALTHFSSGLGLQQFMRNGMLFFYLCLFAHVYSKDTYKLFMSRFPLKN